MARIFYDTCALLNELHHAFETENNFFISNITLKELENIKTSDKKDAETKFRARRLIHLLDSNADKYTIILYKKEWDSYLTDYLSDNNDSRIIISAYKTQQEISEEIIFITADSCCKCLAATLNLTTKYLTDEDKTDYTGFKEILLSDEELGNFYSVVNYNKENLYDLNINEYLIIKNKNNKIIDKYKWTEDR